MAALEAEEAQRFHTLVGADPEVHFAAQTQTDALLSLSAHDVPAEAVLEAQLDPFLDNPDHAAAGLHTRYQHAEYGELQQIGAFWDFGDLPLSLDRPPPALGQHSREMLGGLGIGNIELDRLAAAGVVRL